MTELAGGWRCPNGHVMGQVVRNGSGVRVLLLYREASPTQPSPNVPGFGHLERADIDVMAMVEGYAAEVKCSVCGAVRTWVPGEEALKRLIESARGE